MEKFLFVDKCLFGCSLNISNSQFNRVVVMFFDLLYNINKCFYKVFIVSLVLFDILRIVVFCFVLLVVVVDGGVKIIIIFEIVVCEVCYCEFYYDICDGK